MILESSPVRISMTETYLVGCRLLEDIEIIFATDFVYIPV